MFLRADSSIIYGADMIEAFVGKGGVGKTSISSAYARICSRHGKVALISTDTMPSLSYIFPKKERNIDVFELSEEEIAKEWIRRYGDEVYEIASNFFETGKEIVRHIAYAPGVAEEFMVSKIVEMSESGKYSFVIWDTPASSSTMHLLLLENQFYNHLSQDLKFYLKLKDAFRVNKILEIIEEWRNLANHVWSKLKEANFYIIETPDELSILQAKEIKKELEGMGLSSKIFIKNRVKEKVAKKFEIPELTGDAREIVKGMSAYIKPIFENFHEEASKR